LFICGPYRPLKIISLTIVLGIINLIAYIAPSRIGCLKW
jgi:hypothetical protein